METDTITQPPSELLRQVAMDMSRAVPDLSVTVPTTTTWKTILHATESALGERDGSIVVTEPRTEEHRRRFRQIALENVAAWKSSTSTETVIGLPISTQYDISSLPKPTLASKETVKRLKENMIPLKDILDPYHVSITASITHRTLPLVRANLVLRGIDSDPNTGLEKLDAVGMLWDTGAQMTIITADILSKPFRQFLEEPSHDPYRSGDRQQVQIDAVIAMSNVPIKVSAIAVVLPRSAVPNEHSGIIFGQRQCIDRISYHSIPRSLLTRNGEDVDEGIWGQFVIQEYVNDDDALVRV